ncbi:MAG TPA: 2-dehydropantoate 2-reductase [Candidatus Limnocylindrales bacterium]|nr:2-dehydropantoate 2-reductase [Candidatus Limnocylindrales bacterium]
MSPSETAARPRVAVMGAGAVGSYFGGMLARAGADVTFIARPAHVEAIHCGGLFMDTVTFQERVRAAASADPAGARDADFVLFSVKTLQTEEAARLLAPNLKPQSIVISLQNGVDNVPRIRAASGINALPAVVYVAAALPEPGRVKHSGRGELIVGELPGHEPADSAVPTRAARVAELFNSAGVPCKISGNIEADLWTKMVMNCAGNAVTAIAQTSYGHAARNPHTRDMMARVIEETIAVARASGVRLPDTNFVEMGLKLAAALGDATSSTAQDLSRGKRTEIDSLNGYIVRRGAELHIPTPVSSTLFALVKLIEETLEKRGRPAGASQ